MRKGWGRAKNKTRQQRQGGTYAMREITKNNRKHKIKSTEFKKNT